jgi:hypothetical protein
MKIRFNVTGAKRKALAQAVAEILGEDYRYLGVPTFAYAFDYFIIDREGTLVFDDRMDEGKIGELVAGLAERGFEASVTAAQSHEEAEEEAAPQQEAEEEQQTAEPEAEGSGASMEEDDTFGLTIAMPWAGFDDAAWQNLKNLVSSKEGLIKKALGVDALPMMFTPEKISFPWFETQPDADVAKAATEFIAALCKTAKTQKRVTAKEREVENEKYAFRCFLLRLGFIGAEYKDTRKILLRNLSGNGAFRDGKKKEATGDAVSE